MTPQTLEYESPQDYLDSLTAHDPFAMNWLLERALEPLMGCGVFRYEQDLRGEGVKRARNVSLALLAIAWVVALGGIRWLLRIL